MLDLLFYNYILYFHSFFYLLLFFYAKVQRLPRFSEFLAKTILESRLAFLKDFYINSIAIFGWFIKFIRLVFALEKFYCLCNSFFLVSPCVLQELDGLSLPIISNLAFINVFKSIFFIFMLFLVKLQLFFESLK